MMANYNDTVKGLKARAGELICKRDGYENAWVNAIRVNGQMQKEYWRLYKCCDIKVKALKPVIKLLDILAKVLTIINISPRHHG